MTIKLYYFPTPNGRKVSIALEEMGLDYEVAMINILKGEQQDAEYLKISPNGRIPGLVDDDTTGERIVMFESGAILQYLGRKSGKFYPQSEARRCSVDAWVFWQMAGLGPMSGQVSWFTRVVADKKRDPRDGSYALHRYTKEVKRLYGVLERQLADRDYICDEYSIADIASWTWVTQYHTQVGDIKTDYPNIAAWQLRIAERPAVQRAMLVGTERLPKASNQPIQP
jgi:glutathione S-transferase